MAQKGSNRKIILKIFKDNQECRIKKSKTMKFFSIVKQIARWKRTLPTPSGIAPPLEPPRRTFTRRGRVYLVGGDTVEVVAWTSVLAPPNPTNIPFPSFLVPASSFSIAGASKFIFNCFPDF